MNNSDVGILTKGDTVLVNGKKGIVCSVHEPEWTSHKTNMRCIEFQGADIRLDGQNKYFHAIDIKQLINNT